MGPYICHVIIRFSLNQLKPLDQIGAIIALFVKYHLFLRTWKFAFDLKFIYSDMSPLCQNQEEDLNCHPQMRRK